MTAPSAEGANQREDSQRFLAGDPMAPPDQPAAAAARPARRDAHSLDDVAKPPQRPGVLVAIGIAGMLVIAAVGYATARYMGLLN